MVRQLCLVSLAFLFTVSSYAKCGNSAIIIEGVIVGSAVDATVAIQVAPDPNWEPQPPISIDAKGRFRATVYFDRTKSGARSDTCSRKPDIVTIQLKEAGQVLDQVKINAARDFVRKNRIDYETRSPLTLHAE